MAEVDFAAALAGGGLIGLAATLLMVASGRIAGVSGIVDAVLTPEDGGARWRIAFLGGLMLAPILFMAAGAGPQISFPHGLPLMLAGGFFVGFGARLSGGCTSGHGVCGMARFSKRSLVATATFMAAGVATVFLIRLVSGA